MIPTTADAVAASVALARSLGLPSDRPVVVAEGYSVRVRLDPAPVLTRVVTVGRTLRGEPWDWMQREIDVCRFLEAAGAPVVTAWPDAGPHLANGLEVSLWTWLEPGSESLNPQAYGVLLKELHDVLSEYPVDLPVLVGPLTDIATALRTSDDAVLHRAAERIVPRAMTWPRRPLHGDAHTGNVLMTQDGPVWMDFEDVCVGPTEWDLASRTVSDEYVDAYPGVVDRDLLEECRDLRATQVLAALLTDELQEPELYEEICDRLRRRQDV